MSQRIYMPHTAGSAVPTSMRNRLQWTLNHYWWSVFFCLFVCFTSLRFEGRTVCNSGADQQRGGQSTAWQLALAAFWKTAESHPDLTARAGL
jgi:hypothetical protein